MFAINIFIIVSVVIVVAQAAIVKPRLLNPGGEQFTWPVTWTLSGSPNVAFGVFISWLLLVSRACPSWAWQWQAEGCVCGECNDYCHLPIEVFPISCHFSHQ